MVPDMSDVTIVEMAPRDGLQNERNFVSTADKIKLIDLLGDCRFRRIEATSFVSPKWVPQLADAADVMAGIRRREGIVYSALTPNMKGFTAARQAGADEVAVFGSASEAFSLRNINCSIAESFDRFRPVMEAAKDAGVPVRGYVSCVADCPYSGAVQPSRVATAVAGMLDLGCHEISLGDTTGKGTPETIDAMLKAVLEAVSAERLAGHYHDTGGQAIDNIAVSLDRGLRVFDASVAGLGGCPYAPGAKGNVDTLKVDAALRERGFRTDLDRTALTTAASFAASLRTPSPWRQDLAINASARRI